MIYIVWLPADRFDDRVWFEVYPTKKQAMAAAREYVKNWMPDFTDDVLTGVMYVPHGELVQHGSNLDKIVVQQDTSLYHGA